MPAAIDMMGEVFGRWTVIAKSNKRGSRGGAYWWCRCKCGTQREVSRKGLVSGKSTSCGCYNREISRSMCGENSVHWKDDRGIIEKECTECGKKFHAKYAAKNKGRVYCSIECASKARSKKKGELSPSWKGGQIKTACATCGKELYRKPSQLNKNNNSFCDNECLGAWLSQNVAGSNHYKWDGGEIKVHCAVCGEDLWRRKGVTKKYKKSFCSNECRGVWLSENQCRENHYAWNPELNRDDVIRVRHSKQYKEWRKVIFKQDEYTCQNCGQVGYSLQAHHIKPFAGLYKTDQHHLIFDTDNGITLCKKCHKGFHSTCGLNTTEDQLWEYISNTPFPASTNLV